MRFPQIYNRINKRSTAISQFYGLNQQLIGKDGEWSDMKNISDRFYPAVSNRPKRGMAEMSFSDPKGMLFKNGIFYIDGIKAYYKGTEKFTVTDTDKIIVGIGAYVCVFPDGIMYNTANDTVETIAAKYTQSGTAIFAPLSARSAYTKISVSGIGSSFSVGDAVTISGCSNAAYNATKIITDIGTDYIVVIGSLEEEFTQDSGLTIERKLPKLDFVAERDNRLWGCSSENHEIYCCKAGDPKNWYAYETGADMAYAATVGSDGNFTGISKYSTYMLFFKENTVHILRGDKPSNFSIAEKALPGIRQGCDRSVCIINDILYYVGRDGVYAFDGSIPQKISENITKDISNAVCGQYDSKLYVSCKLDGVQTLLVYDTRYRIWNIEDGERFKYASYTDGQLMYINGSNQLKPIYGDRDETVEWYLESCDMREGAIDNKYISKLKLNVWLSKGAEMYVFTKADDEPMWQRKGYIRSTKNRTYTIPVRPFRCSKYRIKISGKGDFKLLAISRDAEGGSDINGSV